MIRTSTPRSAASCKAFITASSGTKYGAEIQMRRCADCSAVTNRSPAVSSFCDGALGTIIACTFDDALGCGRQFSSGILRVAQYQSPRIVACNCSTTGPSSRTWRVTPRRELRVEPQVFVADVVAADPADHAIDDDHLAMVAEIELKAVAGTLRRLERTDLDPGGAQCLDVGRGQTLAAHLVVEHVDAHARPGALDQRLCRRRPSPSSWIM